MGVCLASQLRFKTLGSVATPNNTGLSRHKAISEGVGGWGNKAKWQYANDQASKLCQQVNHTGAIYIEVKNESPPTLLNLAIL